MQTTLGMMRRLESPDDSDEIKSFMVAAVGLPDNCVVQLSDGNAALLTDDNGGVLSFA